jgi:hypothetical protein
MKAHLRTLGSGIAIGLVMLVSSSSATLAAQKRDSHHAHHLSVQPRSSGYGLAPAPAQELSTAATANAKKLWPGRPLCDDGGYRVYPCDDLGGGP